MIEFIVIVLGIALFLYAFLAGADFGAGILEILPSRVPREERMNIIGRAMGPVWEANHIWLILALVITFNAFPDIFWFISEWFHFPLGALVIGIIFRGASFTFLHYDPVIDNSRKVYHWIFGLSSVWCTMWLGIIAGSLMLGDFSLEDTGMAQRYFLHWLNPFCFLMGLFVSVLMMFNASLFITAESTAYKAHWKMITKRIFIILILMGIVVHATFFVTAHERWKVFFLNPISIALLVFSFILLYPQVYTLEKNKRNLSRIVAGAHLFCIIGAGFVPLYPDLILFRDYKSMNLYASAAELSVLRFLVYALVFGLIAILPAYFFLMKIFKSKSMS